MSNHAETTTKPKRRWVLPTVVGVLSLFLGYGVGASGGEAEPVASTTPEPAPTVTVTAEPSADRSAELDERASALDEREAGLDEREAGLDEREAAITKAEETVAANTVSDGIWTVGVDMKPGTYRASDVSADCYWAILVSGTNGADIVNNGIPGGGNPQVTVSEGQDFETSRCGDWVKQ